LVDMLRFSTARARRGATLLLCLALGSCGLFDSGTPWRDGRYALLWIDLPDDVGLDYDVGSGGWTTLVDVRVFAVGSDARYIVAKQHPKGDRSITNYFIIDKRLDPNRPASGAVMGPLTAREFEVKQRDLQLPPFTKVLASLE